MTLTKTLSKCLAVVLCASLATSAVAGPRSSVANVKLTPNNSLKGALVSPEGKLLPNTQVSISQDSKNVQTISTDAQGKFEFTNLNNGTYELQAPEGVNQVRVWTADVAPSTSKEGVLLVNGEELLRGGPALAAGPLAVIAVVAAVVVATVIIVEEVDDDDGTP